MDVLKEAGLEIAGMVSIFTYGFSIASELFSKAGLSFYSLTNYQSLIELATEKGTVSSSQQEILLKWRDNPAEWKGVQ